MIEPPPAPSPPQHQTTLELHGDRRIDEYHWMRNRDDAETQAHLAAENAYSAAILEPTRQLQDDIYAEMKARIEETDASAPAPRSKYWYLDRTMEGESYPIHCRREGGVDGPESVVLDENALAIGHDYFVLAGMAISPDERRVAYGTDTVGDERMTLRIRDLDTGRDLDDTITNTSYEIAWATDSAVLFYTRPDAAMRSSQVWRHVLGTDPATDVLVYDEPDEHFHLSVRATRSGAYILIAANSSMTSEVRYIPAAEPAATPLILEPRHHGVEYSADHTGDRFLIVTNDQALTFRLVESPIASPGREHWREIITGRPRVTIEAVDCFATHAIVWERSDGLRHLRVLDLDTYASRVIEQPEDVYTISPSANDVFETTAYRFSYSSLTTPRSTIEYDVATTARRALHITPIRGGYDASDYVTERLWATATDGTRVPISLVRRRDTPRTASAPTLLYGYGSYEHSVDPAFSALRLSLLDRGFVFAIAHVRGGGEMGRPWYEQGRLLAKRNTFTDFIAAAETLIDQGYTSPQRLGIRGASAGGLLMGAAVNLRPDLFGAVVAQVPFVDVLTTMCDESLPGVVVEREEWGDPRDPTFYKYIKSYSPYDNVAARAYPTMLVTAGLNDSRVSYWEPAKWVARLRSATTSPHPILLRIETGAGHFGPSGRYDAWRDEARIFAFLVDAIGVSAIDAAGSVPGATDGGAA